MSSEPLRKPESTVAGSTGQIIAPAGLKVDVDAAPSTVVAWKPPAVTIAPPTPLDMLSDAVAKGMSPDLIRDLMGLAREWEANTARKAFDAAIAAAKAEIPIIIKNRKGHTGKYADFAAIAKVVDPIISQHGLHYRFRTEQTDRIKVTCIVSHEAGHSEEHSLSGPPDTSGSKNPIQAIGSTLTYLQRYTLCQAFGIAAGDDDDAQSVGGGNGPQGSITTQQAHHILDRLNAVNANIPAFCQYLKVESVEDIPAARYAEAIKAVEVKESRARAQQ